MAERLDERLIGNTHLLVAAAVEHHGAGAIGLAPEGGDEGGLADPRLAGDEHRLPPVGRRPAAARPVSRSDSLSRPTSTLPAVAARAAGSGTCASSTAAADRSSSRRAEVGPLGGGGRADAQLLSQRPPAALVCPERLPRVPSAPMGRHQELIRRLAEGLEGDGLLGGTHRLGPLPLDDGGLGKKLEAREAQLPQLRLATLDPDARPPREEAAGSDADRLSRRPVRLRRLTGPGGAAVPAR